MSEIACVDISFSGSPLNPPLSCFSEHCRYSDRVTVVLEIIMPSAPPCMIRQNVKLVQWKSSHLLSAHYSSNVLLVFH